MGNAVGLDLDGSDSLVTMAFSEKLWHVGMGGGSDLFWFGVMVSRYYWYQHYVLIFIIIVVL